MALPKKKSRKIVVVGQTFRWVSTGDRTLSPWRTVAPNEVDSEWLAAASRFGLEKVCDFSMKIAVELWEKPVSRLYGIFSGILVDGCLGLEHNLQILPSQASSLIQAGLIDGWNPAERSDFTLYAKGKSPEILKPALLVLPGWNNEIPGYENTEAPTLIWSKSAQ